jgi:AcrR family transcriptional regulator
VYKSAELPLTAEGTSQKGRDVQRSSREDVLDAVAESVRSVGVRRTTMAEVARRAGMSRSTVYTHVSDVTEATAAALTRELVRLLEEAMVGLADPTLTARQRLVRAAVDLAQTVPDDPLFERILELDGELLVPYLTRRLGSSQRAIIDTVTDQVVAGQHDGSIRVTDPRILAFTTFLVVQSFAVSARIAEAEHGREPVLAELEVLLDRMLAPLVASDPDGPAAMDALTGRPTP